MDQQKQKLIFTTKTGADLNQMAMELNIALEFLKIMKALENRLTDNQEKTEEEEED